MCTIAAIIIYRGCLLHRHETENGVPEVCTWSITQLTIKVCLQGDQGVVLHALGLILGICIQLLDSLIPLSLGKN